MSFAGLIVGLGNPGPKYDGTRHNFGFMAVDAFVGRPPAGIRPRLRELKTGGDYILTGLSAPPVLTGEWLFLKPLTFMNLSGKAVARVAGMYKLTAPDILVVHDELDLPLGRMKFKTGGGNAGHRGLESIVECTGMRDFHRLRLGVGKPVLPGMDVVDWVLTRFTPEENKAVDEVLTCACAGMLAFMREGAGAATRLVNSFKYPAE